VALGVLVASAAAAPLVARYGPTEMSKDTVLAPPSWSHPLGTDQFGRDVMSRLVFGARTALAIGGGATMVAAVCGVPLGLWAGFRSGPADALTMRGVDTLLAIPPVLLAMALVAVVGPGSVNAGVAVAVVGLPQFARIARAGVLAQRGMEYVEASVAAGARDGRIVFRTILPNVLSPIIVQVPIGVSRAILLEASLSFLGLGTQPPQPSWGLMISESREYMYAAPWYGIFPGALIALTVLALSDVADRLRGRWRVTGGTVLV
jgi:ABC-type dipeptide/oligopeptide/nickel transport system permease subunit